MLFVTAQIWDKILEELGELDLRKAAKIMFFYAHNDNTPKYLSGKTI